MTVPKGYWIAHVSVTDPHQYKLYVEGAKAAFEKYGATFLARGGRYEEVEGALDRSRHVVIEFPSLEAAHDCFTRQSIKRRANTACQRASPALPLSRVCDPVRAAG